MEDQKLPLKTRTVIATMAALAVAGLATGGFFPCQATAVPPSTVQSNIAAIKLANDAFVPAGGYVETLAVLGQQLTPTLLAVGAAMKSDKRFLNGVAPEV